ncbi:disabled-like protein 2-interacting protein [Elysia marginata]|uniref:Disabled-like protein 2-interacting protein n=1 Tax=Elysia marginata TaxID=1093978 RepID=A0AAV4HFA3_9GAST|nr:disabled-like protein 2-interacting protein [Elysia marginata]
MVVLQTAKPDYEKLSGILASLTKSLEDPTVGQKKPSTGGSSSNNATTSSNNSGSSGGGSNSNSNRRSQIYDNLVHIINSTSSTSTTNTASSSSSKPLESSGRGAIPPSRIGYVIPTARSTNNSKNNSSSSSHTAAISTSSPTEVLIDMLRQCGESAEDLPALAERCRQLENERSRTGTPTTALSSSNASLNSVGRKASGVSAMTTSSTSGTGSPSVASLVNKLNNATATLTRTEERFAAMKNNSSGSRNLSLNSKFGTTGRTGRRRSNQDEGSRGGGEADVTVKDSWSHIPGDNSNSTVTSTDSPYHPHGDYIDLIPFVDDMATQAALEGNSSGSQISIGPISTAASSGYHSLGRPSYGSSSQPPSQADSPVISHSFGPRQSPATGGHTWSSGQQGQGRHQHEMTRELARSPIIHYQPPQQQPSQPLAFANPLFRHQQQQHQDQREEPTHHRGVALSHAHTVQRVSSDSSISSNDEAENSTSSAQGRKGIASGHAHRRGSNTNSSSAAGDGKPAQSSTVASLKKLSQLPTSSSEDSLDEGGGGGGSRGVKISTSAKQGAGGSTGSGHVTSSSQPRNYHHQYRQYGVSPADSTNSSMSSSAISGCSTFPRRHHRNNAGSSSNSSASTTNSSNTGTLKNSRSGNNSNQSETSPPLPPREAISTRTAWKPASANVPGLDFQRQVSTPSPNVGITGGQASRNFQNRARLTTNKAGYVQQRPSPRQGSATNTSDPASNPTGSLSRTYKNSSSGAVSGSSSSHKGSGKSPTSQRRLLTSSIASSLAASAESSSANSTAPPGWQLAQRVKRGSNSSQGTTTESSSSGNNNSSSSNSEASSPQSMMRSSSAQQTNTSGSMQESSSAHSLGQSWGSLGPDDTPTTNTASSPFPTRSDSSGSLGSRGHQKAKGWSHVPHSESSGSLTGRSGTLVHGVENDRGSIHGASSNSNINGKDSTNEQQQQQQNHTNNNLDGTTSDLSTALLDNRGTSDSQSRLPTLTDGSNISSSTSSIPQPPSFLTSKYAVVHPNTAHASPPCSSAPLVTGGMPISSSKTVAAPHNLDLDILKRASTDSILSSVSGSGGLVGSPTGSAPGLPREDSCQSICSSTGSTASGGGTRARLSPQSTVHMGISSVQRKLQEQERTKLEYEQEVHVLRQQLLEAQGRLQSAEVRLLDHELETHRLMEEWRSRLAESQEQMRRQQQEKDGQMVSFMQRLQSIEEDLKREQAEMASAVEHKQQVIEAQEQRIRRLDQANARLVQALADLRGQAARGAGEDNGVLVETAACNGRQEVTGFKTSSC